MAYGFQWLDNVQISVTASAEAIGYIHYFPGNTLNSPSDLHAAVTVQARMIYDAIQNKTGDESGMDRERT